MTRLLLALVVLAIAGCATSGSQNHEATTATVCEIPIRPDPAGRMQAADELYERAARNYSDSPTQENHDAMVQAAAMALEVAAEFVPDSPLKCTQEPRNGL